MKKKIFLSVGYGITAFIVAFSIGTVLNVSTGIPLIGGLLNGVLTAMVLTIGLLTTKYYGNATIMWLVFSIMAIPTMTLGPPGFYKLLIGLIAGLIWDSVYFVFKYNIIGMYLGGGMGSASIMFTLIYALKFGLGENANATLERYQNAFLMIIIMNLVVTMIGLYLGQKIYFSRLIKLKHFQDIDE